MAWEIAHTKTTPHTARLYFIHYGFVDVRGAVVVDIGAYIRETAMFFLSRGAHRVYALEPVDRHYRYLQRNILRNNAMGRVIPMNYG
ncbi:MAG: hypothetical protein QXK53_07585, partial [Nitrososphaerota archaeon]